MARILKESGDLNLINASSALRSYAIQHTEAEIARLTSINETSFLIETIQQVPVPSFAVDREKRLIRANNEFARFVRDIYSSTEGERAAAFKVSDVELWRATQINLQTPALTIFDEQSAAGKAGDYNVIVRSGQRTRRVGVRMIAIPPHDPTALVGFLKA